MKKLFPLMMSALLLLTSCGVASNIREIEKYINIDLSSCDLLSSSDTHGGFHGDGTTFIALQCNKDIASEIENSESFRSLPLSAEIGIMLYGSEYVLYSEVSRSPLSDGDSDPLFPEIKNGYYYFVDRHSDASGELFDSSRLFDRASYNFVVAIYNNDTDILYYCKFDT